MRPAPPLAPDRSAGIAAAKLPRKGPTAEGKQRLSELAKARWAEGGFQKSADGRRRKRRGPSQRRINTLVAEAAREKQNAERIIDVFKDAIQSTQPMHIRLKAVETWLKIEHNDEKLQIREAQTESEKRDREQLLELLSQKLTTGHQALLLRRQLERHQAAHMNGDIVEGQIVSDTEPVHSEGAAE